MKPMDRIAVVTGAGSGIGRATAVMFAREGARVAVVDLEEATAKATAKATEIERAGGQALAVRADVSKAADSDAVVGQTIARWARLDIFFADAGVPQFPTPIEDVENTPDDLARAAVFLASDDAPMITGTCIEVDGGRCI